MSLFRDIYDLDLLSRKVWQSILVLSILRVILCTWTIAFVVLALKWVWVLSESTILKVLLAFQLLPQFYDPISWNVWLQHSPSTMRAWTMVSAWNLRNHVELLGKLFDLFVFILLIEFLFIICSLASGERGGCLCGLVMICKLALFTHLHLVLNLLLRALRICTLALRVLAIQSLRISYEAEILMHKLKWTGIDSSITKLTGIKVWIYSLTFGARRWFLLLCHESLGLFPNLIDLVTVRK